MKKTFQLSHSSTSDFKRCPELYHKKYTDRIKPKIKGASLYFGGAVDIALNFLLENKKSGTLDIGLKEYQNVFLNNIEKGWMLSFDHPGIKYSDKDLSNSLIDEQTDIKTWETELGISREDSIRDQKQKDFKKVSSNSQKMYERLCWLSLKLKGQLMLEAFVRDMLPNIQEVIALQHKISGEIEVADKKVPVIGFIDLICKYKGYDKPVIFDIKTSAMMYKGNAIKLSEQLMMYISAVGQELGTTLAGYMIMLKNMSSDDICSKCLAPKADGSRHKTCNQEINGERCKGDWKSIPKATTQIMVEEISEDQQKKFLTNIINIAKVIKDTRYQNFDSCEDFGLCPYYDLCHNNQRDKYIFPIEKEEPINELIETEKEVND